MGTVNMETMKLFKEILGDKWIDHNNLMNGQTKWQYICQYHEYSLLRRSETSFVIAWRAEYTPGHVAWAQGHYVDCDFAEALNIFNKYIGR